MKLGKFAVLSCLAGAALLVGCAERQTEGPGETEAAAVETPAPLSDPEPVNGWIERELPERVFTSRTQAWSSEVIEIPVAGAGGELEYKLAMNKGDAIVFSIDYGDLGHPGDMISEFHGHTEKNAEGIGDLMFYSKTAGADHSGALVAPFDGIHGWYLKNDGQRDVVVTLNVAGFYSLVDPAE